MRTDATDEALRSLSEIDLATIDAGKGRKGPATSSWDAEIRSWRVARERATGKDDPR